MNKLILTLSIPLIIVSSTCWCYTGYENDSLLTPITVMLFLWLIMFWYYARLIIKDIKKSGLMKTEKRNKIFKILVIMLITLIVLIAIVFVSLGKIFRL